MSQNASRKKKRWKETQDEDDKEDDESNNADFIADEEVEIVDKNSDQQPQATRKYRKRHAIDDFVLDDDDYDLLEEANVTGFRRPKPDNSRKFKRLKKAGSRADHDNRATYQCSYGEPGLRRGSTAEERLQLELFGDFAGTVPEDTLEEEAQGELEDEDVGEEDEMADFIVDVVQDRQLYSKRERKQQKGRCFKASSQANEGKTDGRTKRKSELEQEFEPTLLAERYMTKKDGIIRETDVPERIQRLEEIIGGFPEPGNDKSAEAAWIYERVFGTLSGPVRAQFRHIYRLDKQEVVKQISNVLQLMHEKRVEVPFIALYRQEHCPDFVQDTVDLDGECYNDRRSDDKSKLRRLEALWAVHMWDKRWLRLNKRKLTLRAAYQQRVPSEGLNDTRKEDMLAKLLVALTEAYSEVAVDDVDAKCNLHFPPDEVPAEQGHFKRPKRRSFYTVCRNAGLGNVAKHFGLSSEQFGENLQANDKRYKTRDTPLFPEQVAAELTGSEFPDPASILKGARHMAAVEIFCEPTCREYVRNVFKELCVVSTIPTLEGNSAISSFHKYQPIKWLLNKPISAFRDGQWLLIHEAEERQLLTVTIGLPQEVVDNIVMKDFGSCYISDVVSKASEAWNKQRWQILKEAFFSQFIPFMAKEMRTLLSAQAKHFVAMECGSELWKKVAVAPYVGAKTASRDHIAGEGAPVLSCCWGPGNPPTTFVMLDMVGELIDMIETAHMHIRRQTASGEQQRNKAKNHKDLLDCMKDHEPQVVVVGAAKLCCRSLMEDIVSEIIPQAGPGFVDHVFGDEALALLYENSQVSKAQLPGQPGIVKRAVALGRYLQNPLAMVASLFGHHREILSLKLHPLQEFLSNDEVYEALEEVMVTVTNQVGVDINLCAFHDWLFAPVQFICGLGPRKAAYIQRCLRGQRLNCRSDMMPAMMGRSVFTNAAGFICIRGIGLAASASEGMNPLDETRIHPESYELTKKLAEYATNEEYGTDKEDEQGLTLEMAVERVKENPSLIKALDIENFLSDKCGGSRKRQETIKLIMSELLNGFCDLRAPYRKPSDETIFDMLTGDSEDRLEVGKLIHATVKKVQQNRVFCTLDSGVSAIIQKHELSDENCDDPSKKVCEGNIIACRIKKINKAKFFVELTCKVSQLRHGQIYRKFPLDLYYHENTSLLNSQQDKVKVEKDNGPRKGFRPRMIVHPHFRNISMTATIEALKAKDIGEVIIRPSSKGPSHLSMTMKFYDEIYTHTDILEHGKENSRNLTDFLLLGKKLTIGDRNFADLQEVFAKFVDPLVTHLREMYRHRKFKRGTEAEVDDTLRMDKSKKPKKTCYCFYVASDSPGAFLLSYIRNVDIHREYIYVSPTGFKYRKRSFDTIDKLILYFGRHLDDRMPDPLSGRAVASMLLPKSHSNAGMSSAQGGSGPDSMPGLLGPVTLYSRGWGSKKGSDHVHRWNRPPGVRKMSTTTSGTNKTDAKYSSTETGPTKQQERE